MVFVSLETFVTRFSLLTCITERGLNATIFGLWKIRVSIVACGTISIPEMDGANVVIDSPRV